MYKVLKYFGVVYEFMQTLIFSVESRIRLHSNQINRVLQSNQDNKISLDKKYSNLISKYIKKKSCKVDKLDKTNLDCLDKSNLHDIQVLQDSVSYSEQNL